MDQILPFKDRIAILSDYYDEIQNIYTCTFSRSVKYLDSTLLEFLPSGIINKGKTGFGATTFELTSKRNSIIVEPLKITASSKAGPMHLYVGSETIKHPNKVSNEDIIDYILNEDIEYKKIICVTDSLGRIANILGDEFFEYFLMVDESDSIQVESKYRPSMNSVYSIFKNHPIDNRCMISATPIHFNDPDLASDLRINFKFEEEKARSIKILETKNHLGVVVDQILSLYKKSTSQRIVFAFNNVNKLLKIAEFLVKNGVAKNEISILCGASSKEKSSDFFQELEEERLPSRIVLKTSAYYSGFDLYEQYHLILAIVTSDYLNILSDKRVTQIAGRARNGLLSETIVLNFSEGKNKSQEGYTLESLKKIAETQIQVYQCIESNFNGNQILKERIKESFDAILNKTKIEGYGLVNLNNEKPRISYLGIDAILEAAEAKTELYSSRKGLLEKLKNSGHHVKMMEANSGTKISSKIDDDELENRRNTIQEVVSGNYLDSTVYEHYIGSRDPYIQKASNAYMEFRNFFKKEDLEKVILEKCDNIKEMNGFIKKARFLIIPDTSNDKVFMKANFPVGTTFSRAEVIARMKSFYETKSLGGMSALVENEKELMKEFRLMVHTKPQRNKKLKGATQRYGIEGYNTLGIEPIRFNSDRCMPRNK
jgi:hypothetical protein